MSSGTLPSRGMINGADHIEAARLFTPLGELRQRQGGGEVISLGVELRHDDDAVLVRNNRTEQDCADDRKECRDHPDADAQREDGESGDEPLSPQCPDGMTEADHDCR